MPRGARVTTITLSAAIKPLRRIWMCEPGPYGAAAGTLHMAKLMQEVCGHPSAQAAGLTTRATTGQFGNHAAFTAPAIPCLKFFSTGKVVAAGVKDVRKATETLRVLAQAVADAVGDEAVEACEVRSSMINVGFNLPVGICRHTMRASCASEGCPAGWNGGYPGIVLHPSPGGGSCMIMEGGYCVVSARSPARVLEINALLHAVLAKYPAVKRERV